jgi:hypothetical protein
MFDNIDQRVGYVEAVLSNKITCLKHVVKKLEGIVHREA